ncbi:Iron import ATP-binding/permease protein IrtA [Corynebacterium ciconiae DSM 44920]|uniref:siderophore-interacting protein n=1 Tax=Corynebacterium ciconiae TaxID=227319 RepID=UPI00036889FA|nr:siderophore-interacting protein [Corynebacterium ciconiae]WKD61953.1 Iron import ATP-binding/permease protein IrtA [Corynebacterium ciconiae DSM 44920]
MLNSPYQSLTLPKAPRRNDPQIITAEVASREWIAPRLLRITLAAEEFHHFRLTGPDEYFGLFMPPPGTNYEPLEPYNGGNIRQHTCYLPEEQRPALRWYTVRKLDPTAGTITVDIATHGVTDPNTEGIGPGLRWALSVQPGAAVGYFSAQGLWCHAHPEQLLIGDASSTPSILAILEFLEYTAPESLEHVSVLVLTEDPDDLEPGLVERWSAQLQSCRVQYGSSVEPTPLLEAYHPGYVWGCGEQSLSRAVKRHASEKWGLPAHNIRWSPYWIYGSPRP